MVESLVFILAGLGLLTYAADKFVDGAIDLSVCLRIPTLVVGLIVVGFATSAPELIVSLTAALNGHPSLSIGNAVGSNIANIGLVLGITAVIVPLHLSETTFKNEFRLMLLALAVFTFIISDLIITRTDGAILIFSLLIILSLMIKQSTRGDSHSGQNIEVERPSFWKSSFWVIFGFLLMLIGSEILVKGSVEMARIFGASDLFIGLTIIAIGTSLPELAASVAGALKKEVDIAIGNIIGSNTFNALAVTAMPALLDPFAVSSEALSRDVVVMWVLTIILIIILLMGRNKLTISKLGGCILVTCFCLYQFFLFQTQIVS